MNGGKEFQMEDVAKKLTLWHTPTFRPILTHGELDPIMASVGFVPLPMLPYSGGHVAWREYAFRSETRAGEFLPRPRLPFPRVDGLHLLAYQAFFDALEFYLGAHHVPDLFHVRSMTIRAQDRLLETAYRPMRDCNMDDEGIFVYRDGTLDHITKMTCSSSGSSSNSSSRNDFTISTSSGSKRSSRSSNSSIRLIQLDNLFPRRDVVSLS